MKAVLMEKRQALLNVVCDVDTTRAATDQYNVAFNRSGAALS
jgi:hypothetical protein